MNSLTIRLNLTHYGDVKVVVASDRHERAFMGVPADGAEAGTYLFIQIDRVTLLELVRGEVALYTVMTERGIGLVFETSDYETDTRQLHATAREPGGSVTA